MTQDDQPVFSNQVCGNDNKESESDGENLGMWFFPEKDRTASHPSGQMDKMNHKRIWVTHG